jgi:Tol biopolymer transport system component
MLTLESCRQGPVVRRRALQPLPVVLAGVALAAMLTACGGPGKRGSVAAPTATASATGTNPSTARGSIVFRRWSDTAHTHGAIFSIAPDGSGERQLDQPPASVSDDYPDIAPDGSLIAFQQCGQTHTCRIFTVRPDGTRLRRVGGCPSDERPPHCASVSYPAIASNNKRIAFVRSFNRFRVDQDGYDHQGIYTMSTDGSQLRRVTLPRARSARDDEPQWSPDGRRIVFVRTNLTAKPVDGQAIFVVHADGSALRRITPWNLRAGDGPNWSPDGTRILFRSNASDTFLDSNLFTVGSDGTGLKQITHVAPTTKLYSSGFSPDGASITFGMQGTNDEADIFTMRLDGTRPTPVTRTPLGDSAPDWGSSSG